MTTIFHVTPITPRAFLQEGCAGRALGVSFYRPDDVEVVLAIASAVMFRQRRLFRMAGRVGAGGRMVREAELGGLLRLARAPAVRPRALCDHPRRARRAFPDQRWPSHRLAVWPGVGRAALAHGWAYLAAAALVRAISAGLPRLGGRVRPGPRAYSPRAAQGGMRRLPRANGGGGARARQQVAHLAHDAGHRRGLRLSLCQRGQLLARQERASL
jgi:hypothetical protein